MAVGRFNSTIEGGYTPICGECGVCLCWDISSAEYEENQPFWDAWICQDCNGGKPYQPNQKRAMPPMLIPREERTMNVYQKLQKCRVELKTLPIKESGNNKFAGYTYMELGDFLPHIVDLCDKHQLCTVVSFGSEATLTVFNSENPEEQITFASPMSTAELKGCHQIQNLGAVETYLRRYLYVSAFDIVEHDALDSTQGAPEQRPQQQRQQNHQQKSSTADVITEAQVKMIFAKMKSKGLDPERLKEAFKVESSKQILKSQVNDILAWIDGEAQQPPQ